VAIDPNAAARAYLKLIDDVALRQRMGVAARQRAIDTFDWAVVVKRYQALWQELAEHRKAGAENAVRDIGRPSNPARLDPFLSFASYPSEILTDAHLVAATQGADGARLQLLLQSPLIAFVKPMAPDPDDCARILADLQRRGPLTVADILADAPEARRDRIERGLVWLAKLGLLSIKSPTR